LLNGALVVRKGRALGVEGSLPNIKSVGVVDSSRFSEAIIAVIGFAFTSKITKPIKHGDAYRFAFAAFVAFTAPHACFFVPHGSDIVSVFVPCDVVIGVVKRLIARRLNSHKGSANLDGLRCAVPRAVFVKPARGPIVHSAVIIKEGK